MTDENPPEPQKAIVFPYAWACAIGPRSVIEDAAARGADDGAGHAAYFLALAAAGAVRIVAATRVDSTILGLVSAPEPKP